MRFNYVFLRLALYVLVAIALATLTGLQANNGDWLAAAIAGLATASSLLAASKTKAPLELQDPDRTDL